MIIRLAFILGLLWSAAAIAQDAGEVDLASMSIDGRWDTYYQDHYLGNVRGKVEVDEVANTVRVIYTHPIEDTEWVLTSSHIERDGSDIRIDFDGKSPTLFLNDGRGYPQTEILVPESTPELQVEVESNFTKVQLAPRRKSDLDFVTLELSVTSTETILGKWFYEADPFTQRDHDGAGRVGDFRLEPDGRGIQEGVEAWSRPLPHIHATFVLPDQLSYAGDFSDLPNYPHRFQDNRHRRDNDYRTLVIVGQNLPNSPRYAANFISENEGVNYSFVRYGSRIKQNKHGTDELSRAIEKLFRILPKDTPRSIIDDLDFIIVRADLTEGVLPGPQTFTMNGMADSWKLEFGDNRAVIRYVRLVRPISAGMEGADTEATSDMFIPEVVHIEVVTVINLDVDKIWVTPGRNGKLMNMGPNGAKIPAFRMGRTLTYRTDPIRLVNIGSEAAKQVYKPPLSFNSNTTSPAFYIIPVKSGDLLTAAVAEAGLISIVPTVSKAKVHLTPFEKGVEAGWNTFLLKAAKCHKIELGDLTSANHKKIEQFNERRLFWWDTLSTTIQLGDHAAMMMLRKSFIDMMQKRYDELKNMNSDDNALIAFRRTIEPRVFDLAHSVGNVMVDGENGSKVAFWETFKTSNIENLYSNGKPNVPNWVLRATRQAVEEYAKSVKSARNVAIEIDPCEDIDEMLELTGKGFEAIVQLLFPRLMTLGKTTLEGERNPSWEPNYNARFRIWRIAQLAKQVKTYKSLSAQDSQFILAAVDIVLLPVGVWGGFWGMVATMVIEVVDIGGSMIESVNKFNDSSNEIEFAEASMDVIGYRRLQQARIDEYSSLKLGVDLGFTISMEVGLEIGVKALGNIFEHVQIIRHQASWRRGRDLLQNYEFDIKRIPDTLNRRDYTDMLRFAVDASGKKTLAKVLDNDTQRLLVNLEALQAIAPVPAWARGLSIIYDTALRPIYFRKDLKHISANDAQVLQAALASGGKRAREARELLLYTPFKNAQDFQLRLNKRMNRRTEPLGSEAYDQSSFENVMGRRALALKHWFIDFWPTGTGADFINIRAPDASQDKMVRAFDKSTGTLEMRGASRKHIPSHINADLPVHLSEKGFPSFLYAQLRYLNYKGVGYAGSGKQAFNKVKMSFVTNSRTNAQIAWYKKTYHPEKSWDDFIKEDLTDFLMNTRSVEYARSVINLAGYRIKKIQLSMGGEGIPLRGLREEFRPDIDAETFDDFLKRYNLKETDEGPPPFDIEIDIEPHPQSMSPGIESLPPHRVEPSKRVHVDKSDETINKPMGKNSETKTRPMGENSETKTRPLGGNDSGSIPPDEPLTIDGFDDYDDLMAYLDWLQETVEDQADLVEKVYRQNSRRDDYALTNEEKGRARRSVMNDPDNKGKSTKEIEKLVTKAEDEITDKKLQPIIGRITMKTQYVPGLVDAVDEALESGVPFEIIAHNVENFRGASRTDGLVDAIRNIERSHLEAKGMIVLDGVNNPDANDLDTIITNVITGNMTERDIRLLNSYAEGAEVNGRDFFEDLKKSGSMSQDQSFELFASPEEVERLRAIHQRNLITPDHRNASTDTPRDIFDPDTRTHDPLEINQPESGESLGQTGTERIPTQRRNMTNDVSDQPDLGNTGTQRIPMDFPPSAQNELNQLIDRYNANVPKRQQIDFVKRLWIQETVGRMTRLGVPLESAYEVARRNFTKISDAAAQPDLSVRANIIARSVLEDGSRHITLDEFIEITGVSRDMAERAIASSLDDAGLASLPGMISPAKFYPDISARNF